MKKSILINVVLIIIFVSIILTFTNNKFSLEAKYYNNDKIIQISSEEYNKLIEQKESFVVFVHLPGVCLFNLPFAPIVEEFVSDSKITIYSLDFKDIENTNLNKKIKYSPSVVLIKKGKINEYLDPNKDSDLKYYKSKKEFTEWIKTYIKIK